MRFRAYHRTRRSRAHLRGFRPEISVHPLILPLSIVMLVLFAAPNTFAQEREPSAPQPSKQHEVLKQDVGVWDADVVTWMAGPDAEPVRSKAVERNRLIGGLWLVSDFEGSFAGAKFIGHGQLGYDSVKKKYVGTWIDNMAPILLTLEGSYDEETRTLTMFAEGPNPQTGKMERMRNVTRYVGPDKRIFTMSVDRSGNGKFVKLMQITYRRRPSGK